MMQPEHMMPSLRLLSPITHEQARILAIVLNDARALFAPFAPTPKQHDTIQATCGPRPDPPVCGSQPDHHLQAWHDHNSCACCCEHAMITSLTDGYTVEDYYQALCRGQDLFWFEDTRILAYTDETCHSKTPPNVYPHSIFLRPAWGHSPPEHQFHRIQQDLFDLKATAYIIHVPSARPSRGCSESYIFLNHRSFFRAQTWDIHTHTTNHTNRYYTSPSWHDHTHAPQAPELPYWATWTDQESCDLMYPQVSILMHDLYSNAIHNLPTFCVATTVHERLQQESRMANERMERRTNKNGLVSS